MADADYVDMALDLQPGDRLYVHSDGLTEEANADEEQFGEERLMAAVAESSGASLQESVDSLVQRVIAWRGNEHLRDDVSILAIELL